MTEILENINFTNEKIYKRAHIETWNFIISELKEYQNLLEEKGNAKITTLTNIKKRSLEKLKAAVQNKNEVYDIIVKNVLQIEGKPKNDCWACQFAYKTNKWINVFLTICDNCPLLVVNKGNLKVRCDYSSSVYSKLSDLIENHYFKKAIKLAEEIKDAWREIND